MYLFCSPARHYPLRNLRQQFLLTELSTCLQFIIVLSLLNSANCKLNADTDSLCTSAKATALAQLWSILELFRPQGRRNSSRLRQRRRQSPNAAIYQNIFNCLKMFLPYISKDFFIRMVLLTNLDAVKRFYFILNRLYEINDC